MNLTSIAACFASACVLAAASLAPAQEPFKLAPAVAVEAEQFTVDRGFRVVKMGEGNYAVDIIGFVHTGGERFLSAPAEDSAAEAHKDINDRFFRYPHGNAVLGRRSKPEELALLDTPMGRF